VTGAKLAIVDAHQHFWDLGRNYLPWLRDEPPIAFRYGDYRALKRDYLPADYRADAADFEILGTVYVEAEWDPRDPLGETRWVTRLAAETGLPSAMVAQAWLDREDVAELLAAQAAFPLVRGIRHKPRPVGPVDPRRLDNRSTMADETWRRGYALLARHGLSFDLQVPYWHAEDAARLAADFPATTIIVNHAMLPADRSAEGLAVWRRALARVAERPNVALKISGLGTEGGWPLEAQRPVVLDAIRIFGAERCLFASNYPVDSLVGGFRTIFSGFDAITRHLPASDRLRLFADNARRIYRLELSDSRRRS
jgi:predicted TIM-barrel fold metal-dependent hydrolase